MNCRLTWLFVVRYDMKRNAKSSFSLQIQDCISRGCSYDVILIVVSSRKNHPVSVKLNIHTINKFCITILVILQINENKCLKVCTNNKRDKNCNTLFQTTRNNYTIITEKNVSFWNKIYHLYCYLIVA